MKNHFDLPPDLLQLIEKREQDERRQEERRQENSADVVDAAEPSPPAAGPASPSPERRAGADRRSGDDRRSND